MNKPDADERPGPDLEPIETYLAALAVPSDDFDAALGTCLLRIEEAAPAFRTALVEAADGVQFSDADWSLFFNGLHVLGAARDQASFKPLLRLVGLPPAALEDLLGDAITATLAKIATGLFDGDTAALFEAISRRGTDDFARSALLGAATFLAWEGRIDAELMKGFLSRFGEKKLADAEDCALMGWIEAIALLGLRELAPLVEQAFADGRIPADLITPSEFEADLAAAERAPQDRERLKRAHLGYIEDVADALATFGQPPYASDGVDDDFPEPVRNPYRNVGRNDPCPCGSGRKFKKCCLANA